MMTVATKFTAILMPLRGLQRAQESKLATILEVGVVRVCTGAHTTTSSSLGQTGALGTLLRTEVPLRLPDSPLGLGRSSVKLLSK